MYNIQVISSYSLPLTLVEYQTAILRGDFVHAEKVLPSVPKDQGNKIARFLEGQGHFEQALAIATEPEHKFELAMNLGKLEICYKIALELDHEQKWKLIGDSALSNWNYGLALECWKRANDLSSLFLLYQTSGNAQGLQEVAEMAETKGETNIAFVSQLTLGKMEKCLDILIKSDRIPEAAFFAQAHLPSKVDQVVTLWKDFLVKQGKSKAASSLKSPSENPDAFPDLPYALAAQVYRDASLSGGYEPASTYPQQIPQNLAEELKNRFKPENAMDAVKALIDKQREGRKAQQNIPPASNSSSESNVSKPSIPVLTSKQASPPKPVPELLNKITNIAGESSSHSLENSVSSLPIAVTPNKIAKPSAPCSASSSSSHPAIPLQSPTKKTAVVMENNVKVDDKPSIAQSQSQSHFVSSLLNGDSEVNDSQSHLSLEVNTTGTGSAKDEIDVPSLNRAFEEEFEEFSNEGEGFDDPSDIPPDIDDDEIDALLS